MFFFGPSFFSLSWTTATFSIPIIQHLMQFADMIPHGKRAIIGHPYDLTKKRNQSPEEDEPNCVVYESRFLYFSEATKICNQCIDNIREFLIYCETTEPITQSTATISVPPAAADDIVTTMNNHKRKLVPIATIATARKKMHAFMEENQCPETDDCDICAFKAVQFSPSTSICNPCIRKIGKFLDSCEEENKEWLELFQDKHCTSCNSSKPLSKFVIEKVKCNNCLEYAYVCSNCNVNDYSKNFQTLCTGCKTLDLSKVIKCSKCLTSLTDGGREYNCTECNAVDHMCSHCSARNLRACNACVKCK